MKKLTYKHINALIVGNSDNANYLAQKIRGRIKDVVTADIAATRFVDTQTASIDGQLLTFGRALVVNEPEPIANQKTLTGSLLVVGDDRVALQTVVQHIPSSQQIYLASENHNILPEFDTSIQDVMSRYLKKSKVKVLFATNVLSDLEKEKRHFVVAESEGKPVKMIVDTVVYSNNIDDQLLHMGIENAVPKLKFSPGITINKSISKHIAVVTEQTLSIGDCDTVLKFMSGGTRGFVLERMHSAEIHMPGTTFFSYGLLEQNIGNIHTGYRKAVVKIPVHDPTAPTNFIKIIASVSGKVLGISGVVGTEQLTDNLLYYFVRHKVHIGQVKDMYTVSGILGKYIHEAIDSI